MITNPPETEHDCVFRSCSHRCFLSISCRASFTYVCMYVYIYIYIYIHTYVRYITLHCIALHCIALHYIALHCIALHSLHYITLHYITLHYITLHYITLHYITLHYITLYIYICNSGLGFRVVCDLLIASHRHETPQWTNDILQKDSGEACNQTQIWTSAVRKGEPESFTTDNEASVHTHIRTMTNARLSEPASRHTKKQLRRRKARAAP